MKYLTISLISLFMVGLISCNVNSNEIVIIPIDNFYDNDEDNELLAKDLLSYDMRTKLRGVLSAEEMKKLEHVKPEYFVQAESKEVDIRLKFINEGKDVKEKLLGIFEPFLLEKVEEHKTKENEVNSAIVKAKEFSAFIEDSQLDSIWNQTTERTKLFVTKEKIEEEVMAMIKAVGKCGEKKVVSRQIYSELDGGIQGDFYVVVFECEGGSIEHFTLENIEGKMNFQGFAWYYPK